MMMCSILRFELQQTKLKLTSWISSVQYFFTLMNTLMAPVKSAESSTSVWSVFRAPERGEDIFKHLNDSTDVMMVEEWVRANLPEGIVSESVESRLLHSASGFSVPVSWGTIRLGWGAKIAEVTTALCAKRKVRLVVRERFLTDVSILHKTLLPLIASQKSLRSRLTDVNLLRSW